MHVQGFLIEKKITGGNCKVAGALSHRDNGSLVECREDPPSAESNEKLPLDNFDNQGAVIK